MVNGFVLNLYQAFQSVYEFLSTSVGEAISNSINIDLPSWQIFDISIFGLMTTGITIFVGYALISWLIDLLP